MFYKFDIHGLFCGTSEEEVARSTSVAPPDDASKKWNWNGYEWIGLPIDWSYVQPEYVKPVVDSSTDESSQNVTPTAE